MQNIQSQSDYDLRYPTVPLARWRENVVSAARMIADGDHQRRHWSNPDSPAWETPEELICTLYNDFQFELFLQDCAFSLTEAQLDAGRALRQAIDQFCRETPDFLDRQSTLTDSKWTRISLLARTFVQVIENLESAGFNV